MRVAQFLSCAAYGFLSVAASKCDTETCSSPAKGVALVQSTAKLSKHSSLNFDDNETHTEYHVVCHRHGCKEVQANLEVLRNQGQVAQAALTACGTERANLESGLRKVAKERGVVEADLAKCGVDRAALEKQVQECGVNRGKLQQDLSQCATERAALEKELKQCAEVDRPAAEKSLRECGVARAALEKELKQLADKLAGGGTSARRRRRRKNSLLETQANSTLHAEIMRVENKLRAEKSRADDLSKKLAQYGKQLQDTEKKLNAAFDKFDDTIKKTDANDKKIGSATQDLSKVDGELTDASKKADALKNSFDKLNDDSKKLTKKQADAAKTLYENGIAQADAQVDLLEMIATDKTELEEQLRRKHSDLSQSLVQKKKEVAEKTESEEDCDDLRADVITLSGKLAIVQAKLLACLSAKKEIRAKTEHAQEAASKAREGLQKCLSTKKTLTAALAQCKDSCAKTSVLLSECLSRKKVLAVKIKECHDARDMARTKLQECLDRKEELKDKIADLEAKLKSAGLLQGDSRAHEDMTLTSAVQAVLSIMQELDGAEAQAEVDAALAGSSEKAVVSIGSTIAQSLVASVAAFKESNDAMKAVVQAGGEIEANIAAVADNLNKAKEDETVAYAEALGQDKR